MKRILEYQKIDGELLQIEKKIKNSNSQKTIDRENNIANDSRNKMKELDKKAEQLIKEFNNLREIMKDNVKNIEILEKQKVEMQDKARVKTLYDNIRKVNNNLGVIENRLKTLTATIDNVLKSFNTARKTAEVSKEKRKQAQVELDGICQKYEKPIKDLTEKLTELEENVDPKLLEAYKRLRDTKFPPFVQVLDEDGQNRCGGCKCVIPVGRMDKLKTNEYIECESCHRIIYLNDKDK